MLQVELHDLHTPGLTGLDFGWFGRLICFNCKKLDGTIIWCNSKIMWPLTKGQCFYMAPNPWICQHRPETITFSVISAHIIVKQQPRQFIDIIDIIHLVVVVLPSIFRLSQIFTVPSLEHVAKMECSSETRIRFTADLCSWRWATRRPFGCQPAM